MILTVYVRAEVSRWVDTHGSWVVPVGAMKRVRPLSKNPQPISLRSLGGIWNDRPRF